MHIMVNGKKENISPHTIGDYILSKGLNPKALVVEYNGQVVAEAQWHRIFLNEGDQLELLSFVGGG